MSAKMTVLEMVQDIMSALDSDEVTSITDTVESAQIEKVLKQVYFQMGSNQLIPEHQQLDQLETVSLVDFPGALNYLHVPATVQELMFIKYNRIMDGDTQDAFTEIKFLCHQDFLDLVTKNRSDDTDNNTQVTDPTSGVTYYVNKLLPPTWWTSFDDEYIAFDSLDMDVDTVQMTGAKSIIYASVVPSWTTDDTFIPAIDDNLFPFLVAEAKSTCFVNLKQQANPKIEKQGREQKIAIQHRKFKTRASEKGYSGSTGPNYGRKGTYKGGVYSRTSY